MSITAAFERDPEDIVTLLYQLLLLRNPDRDGLLAHVRALESGSTTLHKMVEAFIISPEFRQINKGVVDHLQTERLNHVEVESLGCVFSLPSGAAASELTSAAGYEPWVLPYFLDCCRPGLAVLDIGASWGFFALPSAQKVGAKGRVYALEASPVNCSILAKSIAASAIENITILPFGLSDRLGSEFLARQFRSNNNFLGVDIQVGANRLDGYDVVPVITLDMIQPGLGHVDIVKMDIEGMEYRAVMGGLNFFREQKPLLFMEYSPDFQRIGSHVEGDALLSLLLDMDYGVEILHRQGAREAIKPADKGDTISLINSAWRRHVADDGGTHLDLCFMQPHHAALH